MRRDAVHAAAFDDGKQTRHPRIPRRRRHQRPRVCAGEVVRRRAPHRHPLRASRRAHSAPTALYDELSRRTGLRLTTGREQIRAVVPTGEDCELLQLEVGEAALAIDRLATLQGELVKCRHTIIRGDRFSLVAEFSPRSGFQFEVSIMNMSGIGA